MLIIFLITIIVLIVVYFGYLFVHYLPDLKNLDVGSIAAEQQNEARSKILKEKLSRRGSKLKTKLNKFIVPAKEATDSWLTDLKNKVATLEDKYHGSSKKKKNPNLTLGEMLEQAVDLIRQKQYLSAEKVLIGVIAKDKKNIRAYELFGQLYSEDKKYEQAEEIYKHLLRLITIKSVNVKRLNAINVLDDQLAEAEIDFLSSLDVNPKIAIYYSDLGEVYEQMANIENALDCFLKAAAIEPNNPKYLDKLIEFSIKVGDRGLAKKMFNHMRKINPENNKLEVWSEDIEKIK